MKTQNESKNKQKITNEKPISLNLNFKDAVAALLATKPPPKNNKKRKTNKSSK